MYSPCFEEIIFDPRLQAYLEKKTFYEKNRIQPCIPLELEFSITEEDIRKINDYKKPKLVKKPMTTPNHHTPKIQYRNRVHDQSLSPCRRAKLNHQPQTKEILDKLERHKELPVFLKGHVRIPQSMRTYNNECVDKLRKKYNDDRNTNLAIMRMQMESNKDSEMKDIMADMQLGMPYNTSKSYGYDNPVEHYYDYIDGEIQAPEHVVLPFPRGGYSTRLDNTSQRKSYTREIM